MEEPVLEFRSVTKRYGDVPAVDAVSFRIEPGELFTLLGPSGCGKSTTLRLTAGLEEPDDGEILFQGRPIAAPRDGVFVTPDKREMGMVFQSYAIWPHLTVFENVAFPLKVRREPSRSLRKKVMDALEIVGLAGLEGRGATELSGGQQQRVALARALVYTPAILLLDEPLSNLDAKLREQMRFEMKSLQRRLNLTVLYVTHDQTEAMTMSDRIAVMHSGRFEQVGAPAEVYDRPATSFVSEFLGRTVVLEGTVQTEGDGLRIELPEGAGRICLKANHSDKLAAGMRVRIVSRPEDVDILPIGEIKPNQVAAKVGEVAYLGDRMEYNVSAAGKSFVLSAGKRQRHESGSEIRLAFDPDCLTVLPLGGFS